MLLVSGAEQIDLVASVASLPELEAAVDEHDPDVVLTDIRMPPTMTDEGIGAAEQLGATHPSIGVVVLSQHLEAKFAPLRHPRTRVHDRDPGGQVSSDARTLVWGPATALQCEAQKGHAGAPDGREEASH